MQYADITGRQQEVLETYAEMIAESDQCPTASEVASILGTSTRAVQHHLTALEKHGYIKRRPGMRNVILTDKVE